MSLDNLIDSIIDNAKKLKQKIREDIKDYETAIAILFTGRALDNITTWYALIKGIAEESNPIANGAYNMLGYNSIIPLSLLEAPTIFSIGYIMDKIMTNSIGTKIDIGKYIIYGVGIASYFVALHNIDIILGGNGFINVNQNNYPLSALPFLSAYFLSSIYGGIKNVARIIKDKNKYEKM